MRVVIDTNTIVSALFWRGAPRRLLEVARLGAIDLFVSPDLLAEMEDVLQREKFSARLTLAGCSVRELVLGYAALARVVEPPAIAPAVLADLDDDNVLACALAAHANYIVSGDNHLLQLKQYQGIPILSVAQFLQEIAPGTA